MLALLLLVTSASPSSSQYPEPRVQVPKIWDEAELRTWATPLAGLGLPPSYASEEEYHAAPIDNLRTYPVYHPRHEPLGSRAWLVERDRGR